MNRVPYNMPPVMRPRVPRRKPSFCWEIVVVPTLVILFIWFTRHIDADSWEDFLVYIGVRNRERFSMIAVAGILVCTACIIARILGDNRKGGS